MPAITTEMIKAAYNAAKSVYHDNESRSTVLDELESNHGMNRGSASNYVLIFKKMITGQEYTRTINTKATEYFLQSIFSDYGPNKLNNALQAAKMHVAGRPNGVKLKSVVRLIEEYQGILDISQHNFPEEIVSENEYFEGIKKQVTVNAYERNFKARAKCIEHHGLDCKVCGFNFVQAYGDIGKNYIHVHHVKPLSDIKESYQVDPVTDLVPVCPNCHAMLHRKNPAYTILDLITQLNVYREKVSISNSLTN